MSMNVNDKCIRTIAKKMDKIFFVLISYNSTTLLA